MDAAISIHQVVTTKFLPSAVKFMYNWNMRELSNIFQGCCAANSSYYTQPKMLIRLFIHEAQRVFSDRLVSEKEIDVFNAAFEEVNKKCLKDTISSEEQVQQFDWRSVAPLVFAIAHF